MLQDSANRRETRYRAETILVPDENTGVDARQVEVARSNFVIRFGNEPLREYTTIQIAEVLRSPTGSFVLNDQMIPTSLTVQASERLEALVRRQLELLVGKSASLTDRYRGASAQREVSPDDVKALGLLSTINSYIPLLNHHMAHSESHPEDLYLTLLSLAGRLTAYLPDVGIHPRDFPAYDHADLTTCYNRLAQILLDMLGEAQVRANYVDIPLQLVRENLYSASIEAGLLQQAQFYLVARSDTLAEGTLVEELPRMLRIASPDTIDAVLRSYTRALPVEHTHRIPAALPVDAQANYFQLVKRGPFWEAINDKGGLSIFVPSEFSAIDLKLVAVDAP